MFRILGVFLLLSLVYAKHEIYDGHILYEVTVNDVDQAKLMNELESRLQLDVWSHTLPGHPGQVLVAKQMRNEFQRALEAAEVKYEVVVENIKELLDLEDQKLSEAATKGANRTRSGGLAFDRIYNTAQINAYLEEIAALYPNIVTLVTAGHSFEGRPIKYLKISTTNFQDTTKPIVYMQTLLHAREWITQPATLYAIEKLVKDVAEQDLLNNIDWIILPVANPDGFEYTQGIRISAPHFHVVFSVTQLECFLKAGGAEGEQPSPAVTKCRHPWEPERLRLVAEGERAALPAAPEQLRFRMTRLWRKNRATGYMIGDLCAGVDLNRNFDFEWSQYSSNSACSETFHGRGPFSEPETTAIRDIVLEHSDRLSLFLDIHSFGSYILYGYGSGQLPSNGLTLHLVGIRMATTIDSVKMSWNPNYVVGNTAAVLYEASGTAQDYAQSLGSVLSYTFELPGYRYGLGTGLGFLVDPDFIEQAGFETWEGIKTGARYVLDNFVARDGAQ